MVFTLMEQIILEPESKLEPKNFGCLELEAEPIISVSPPQPCFRTVVLNRRGVKKFLGGREPLHALQQRKILNGNVSLSNVTPVLILRRYVLFG